METKRFIGNDMTRIFARVRRELGPEAVIVQTRSLLREGADPLIEVLAAPIGGGDDALTLALQRALVQGSLERVEAPSSRGLTIGDLEDIAARESAEQEALREFDRAYQEREPEPAPEWLEGFVSAAGARRPHPAEALPTGATEREDALGPFGVPPVAPPPPVEWRPRPRIVTRNSPEQPAPAPGPLREPEAPAARRFVPLETGLIGTLVAAGFSPLAARAIAEASPEAASAQAALEAALTALEAAYPVENRTAIITIQGAPGSGRTTALMRMALDCADSGREAVLVAADSSHAGGRAQVHAYGEAIGLAVFDAFAPQDLVHAVTRAPKGACVFVDVPAGRWNPPPIPGVPHFVYAAVPAHWQPATVAGGLADLDLPSCAGAVITGVDLATGLTPALSLLVEAQLGLAFLSSGRDVGTGIAVADPFTLASGVFTTSSRETSDGRLVATA